MHSSLCICILSNIRYLNVFEVLEYRFKMHVLMSEPNLIDFNISLKTYFLQHCETICNGLHQSNQKHKNIILSINCIKVNIVLVA